MSILNDIPPNVCVYEIALHSIMNWSVFTNKLRLRAKEGTR